MRMSTLVLAGCLCGAGLVPAEADPVTLSGSGILNLPMSTSPCLSGAFGLGFTACFGDPYSFTVSFTPSFVDLDPHPLGGRYALGPGTARVTLGQIR